MPQQRLLMIAPAPVIDLGGGRLRLDVKFVEGMRLHRALWDGPLSCVLWQGAGQIPFGQDYDRQELGFDLDILPPGQPVQASHLAGAGLVVASADMSATLGLAGACRSVGAGLVYVVEYTLGTRLRILWLERGRAPIGKVKSTLWLLAQERRLRAAFRAADAVQFNGYPAAAAYGGLARDSLMFLDGRVRSSMMATEAEMTARAGRLRSGAPLRIVHSGRLETLKGAQDLVPVARALAAAGVAFTLEIFGAGSLADEIARDIAAAGLAGQITLHPAVDFGSVLVPHMRSGADLFLSCHRQADPSCTYLESFGCGVPVIGYDNAMWRALCDDSRGGWVSPLGRTEAMARLLADLCARPDDVLEAGQRALAFARAHDFETEFARRMAHLAGVAKASGGR